MASLQEYKCPCCGGAISFDSTLQKMKCPYCDTEFDVASFQAYDESLDQQQPDNMQWQTDTQSQLSEEETQGLRSYVCDSCGGEIVCDENTAATSCPFCGNPVVMMGQLAGTLRPDYVIPFKLDKEAAKRALSEHYKGKRLLPKVFKDQNHIEEIKGIYIPYWLFDADADADIRYRATKIRSWSTADYDYTETRFYAVSRSGSIGFERVPVDGDSKIPNDLTESLEPYDYSEATDFRTAYLAGYFADKYDVDAGQSVSRANERIKRSTEQAFASTVTGYSTVSAESSSIRLRDGKEKYALLPAWILGTKWNGKNYLFAMNGQTGKMVGDLPVDKGAYAKWLFGLTALIGAVVFAGSYLLWML